MIMRLRSPRPPLLIAVYSICMYPLHHSILSGPKYGARASSGLWRKEGGEKKKDRLARKANLIHE